MTPSPTIAMSATPGSTPVDDSACVSVGVSAWVGGVGMVCDRFGLGVMGCVLELRLVEIVR